MDNFDDHQERHGRGASVSSLIGTSTPSECDFSLPFESRFADLGHGYLINEDRVFTSSPKSTRNIGILDSIQDVINELKQVKINKLQKCSKEEQISINSLTPLHVAAALGDALAVRRLVNEADFDVDASSTGQQTPLLMACSSGHIEAVRVLVRLGADVNARNDKGMTSLILASINNDKTAIHLLVKRGAKVKERNLKGQTALHFAAYHGSSIAVKELLDKGSDPETKTNEGCTPLHLAVENTNEMCSCPLGIL